MSNFLYFLLWMLGAIGLGILLGRFFALGSSPEYDEPYYSPEIVEMLRKKSL